MSVNEDGVCEPAELELHGPGRRLDVERRVVRRVLPVRIQRDRDHAWSQHALNDRSGVTSRRTERALRSVTTRIEQAYVAARHMHVFVHFCNLQTDHHFDWLCGSGCSDARPRRGL